MITCKVFSNRAKQQAGIKSPKTGKVIWVPWDAFRPGRMEFLGGICGSSIKTQWNKEGVKGFSPAELKWLYENSL